MSNTKQKKSIQAVKLDYTGSFDMFTKPFNSIVGWLNYHIKTKFSKSKFKSKETLQTTAWLIEDELIYTRNKILLPLKVCLNQYPEESKAFKEHIINFNLYLADHKESLDFQFIEVIKTGSGDLSVNIIDDYIKNFFKNTSSKAWVNTLNALEKTYLKDMREILNSSIKDNNNKDFVYSTTYLLISVFKKRSEIELKNQITYLNTKKNTLLEDTYFMRCEKLTNEELEEFAINSLNKLQ